MLSKLHASKSLALITNHSAQVNESRDSSTEKEKVGMGEGRSEGYSEGWVRDIVRDVVEGVT